MGSGTLLRVSLPAVPGLGTLSLPHQLQRGTGSSYSSLSTLSRKEVITHTP